MCRRARKAHDGGCRYNLPMTQSALSIRVTPPSHVSDGLAIARNARIDA